MTLPSSEVVLIVPVICALFGSTGREPQNGIEFILIVQPKWPRVPMSLDGHRALLMKPF